jgi:uncharacterized cupredoxin-like copper-binding protein
MFRTPGVGLLAAFVAVALAACGGDDGPRRIVQIAQTDEACSPAAIDAKAGERLTFEIKNDGKKDHEVEGIEGMKLEELLVPAGRTRNLDYTTPKSGGTQKIKCYIPGGSSTIIEVRVSGDMGAAPGGSSGPGKAALTTKKAQATITVDLTEFRVVPDAPKVGAGPTKFVARNVSKMYVHELAVLRVKADGSFENMGEVEDIDPGKSGEVVLDLAKGRYVLACLIVPGQAGSPVDHFQQGMRVDFEVN